MPLSGPGHGRSPYTPPGFTPNRRPVGYPGVTGGPDLPKDPRLLAQLPGSLPFRGDPGPTLDPIMKQSLSALCRAILHEGCADEFFEKLRRELRRAHLRAQPPTWMEPPFGATAIIDTNTAEVAIPVGGAFTEVVGFTIPNRARAVVTHVGADILPVGLDEENLIRWRVFVSGGAPNSSITGSTGGGNLQAMREWLGSVSEPHQLRAPVRMKEGDAFSFQIADADANAPMDARGIVIGWLFQSADPTGEGYAGWMAD